MVKIWAIVLVQHAHLLFMVHIGWGICYLHEVVNRRQKAYRLSALVFKKRWATSNDITQYGLGFSRCSYPGLCDWRAPSSQTNLRLFKMRTDCLLNRAEKKHLEKNCFVWLAFVWRIISHVPKTEMEKLILKIKLLYSHGFCIWSTYILVLYLANLIIHKAFKITISCPTVKNAIFLYMG